MIYVDEAVYKKPNGRVSYAHMVSDVSSEELHTFAESINVKRHFFHTSKRHRHYDITAAQQILAIEAGAKLITSKEIVLLLRSKKE